MKMNIDRRSVLRAGVGMLVAAAMPAMARAKGFFAAHDLPIGLQLYTLGDAMRDIEGTLMRVGSIGYRSVELPTLSAGGGAALRAAADKAGVRIGSVHLGAMPMGTALSLASEPGQIAAELQVLGTSDVVMPFPLMPANRPKPAPGETPQAMLGRVFAEVGADHWQRTAALLNERAAALKREGLRLGYHNHNIEFAPIGSTTGWEILVAETDPELVSFEVDVGWLAAAGVDPVAFVKHHAGRLRQMHVKDIRASTKPNFVLAMDSTEVGSGSIDWPKLLPAAYGAGIRQFYVEQEPPFAIDRFEAIAKSYIYLNTQV